MNNKHIHDLTVRLSQALDQNYDVVNMDAVIAVISSLEGTTITKEQLEATRLAKYINELRRRTKSEHLARRAKSLLKKWREMVGIQQQTSDMPSGSNIVAVTSNDNAISTNIQHHRSQPTSPIVCIQLENNSTKNSKSNAHGDFLRLTASNPATITNVSSLTRSANVNVHINNNTNKRLELAESRQSAAASTSAYLAVSNDKEKQPTSFANLLTGFSSDNSSISYSTKTNASSAGFLTISPHVTRKISKSNTRDVTVKSQTETFIIDQSSNSNSEISFKTSNHKKSIVTSAPIVIDIQDSNSGSNIIVPKKTEQILSDIGQVADSSSKGLSAVFSNTMNFKPKKTKKDKKRKERESQAEMVSNRTVTQLMAYDDTSSTLHRQINSAEDEKLQYPISNISEILSLSNSSMSSIFPIDGLSRVMNEQQRTDLTTENSRKSLSNAVPMSDLTFTGKFKQHNSLLAPLTSVQSNQDITDFNTRNICQVSSPRKTGLARQQQTLVTNKFIPFSGSGCNSNESTSNSRASQFDMIDIVCQDNNQTKMVDALRLQKKQDINIFSVQKQTDNLLLPPTTTSRLVSPQTESNPDSIIVFPEEKVPKKRGRKKGSKGVDATIAKETSLSSAMLITSLGNKKVKTTKELFVEMQNRKLGISTITSTSLPTVSTWTSSTHQQLPSRPESSCSDPIDSDSCTMTSEPSRDSAAVLKNVRHGRLSIESNSSSQLPTPLKTSNTSSKQLLPSISVEKQLSDLLKKLPPVPNISDIEIECVTDQVPCTCQVIEVMSTIPLTDLKSDIKEEQVLTTMTIPNNSDNTVETQPIISVNIPNKYELDQTKERILTLPVASQKPKRSIFDLDFDDDDDPLHTLMAEATAVKQERNSQCGATINTSTAKDSKYLLVCPDRKEISQSRRAPPPELIIPQQPIEPVPIFPTYQAKEDINCVAKQRFEVQTQQITQFHVNALHNCYIANVNGNWDNSDTSTTTLSVESSVTSHLTCMNGSNVVPKYGSLINEHIKKDLSDIKYTKKFEPRNQLQAFKDNLTSLPFLGGARKIYKTANKKRRSHLCRIFHKVKKDEENLLQYGPLKTTRLFNTVGTTNIVGNSNIVLSDISIEVAENTGLALSGNTAQSSAPVSIDDCVLNSQNLLTIADEVNSFSNANKNATLNSVKSEFFSAVCENQNVAQITPADSQRQILDISNFEKLNDLLAIKTDDNTSSRRSSSCSNSSLKQTQESINLKLRRRRLQQQQETNIPPQVETCRKRRRKKTNSKKSSIIDGKEHEHKKNPIIKRIKIAINGDMATSRQISIGSSNNTTDEEEADINEQQHDGYEQSSIDTEEKSVYEDYNIIADDENEPDDHELEDDDDEEDEEDDYTGDYHEVVTRDISVQSTGNNHIVLTIKKTPSKTNSPSYSLSAMSPVITTAPANNGSNSILTTTSKAEEVLNSNIQAEYNKTDETHKLNDIRAEATFGNCNIDQTESLNINDPNINENNLFIGVTSPTVNIENSILSEQIIIPTYSTMVKQHMRRRKIKKLKTLNLLNNALTTAKPKLHQQLFFPHELYVSTKIGIKENILNISSCSSSCAEDSQYEYYTSSSTEDNAKSISKGHVKYKQSPLMSINKVRPSECSTCSSCDISTSSIYFEEITELNEEMNSLITASNNEEIENESVLNINTELETHNSQILQFRDVKSFADIDNKEYVFPLGNNGKLSSFNNIYPTYRVNHIENVENVNANAMVTDYVSYNNDATSLMHRHKEQQLKQLPNENCDDYNNLYNNNNNFNLNKYDSTNKSSLEHNDSYKKYSCNKHSSGNSDVDTCNCKSANSKSTDNENASRNNTDVVQSEQKPYKEYRTGLRAVDEDVDDEDGNNCARIQQFKEWHQVLQLRSYNDELLTVLPYVVLE